MGRRALYSFAVSLVAVLVVALLVVALPAHGTRAQEASMPNPRGASQSDPASAVDNASTCPPTVNGLIYGDDDIECYGDPVIAMVADPETGETYGAQSVYQYWDGKTTVYVAVVIDRRVNDNVFASEDFDTWPCDETYQKSAGWGNPPPAPKWHTFADLEGSDHVVFTMTCGANTYEWQQDYLYFTVEPEGVVWRSDVDGPDGTPPEDPSLLDLTSSSSLAWNMNNTGWDVTMAASDCSTATRVEKGDWKSPDVNENDVVTDEIGYPPLSTWPSDTITHETTISWEWPLVYEFSFNWHKACNQEPIEIQVVSTHNSPAKGEVEDVPLAVELLSFTGKAGNRAAVLSWETASEIDNLGFNLYRAEDIHGERVKLNAELIATSVPPGSPSGAAYSYTDMRLAQGTTYYYWLEDVDITGRTELHGPVQVSLSGRPGLRELLRRVLP